MKLGSSLVIIIPLLVAGLIVGGVFVWRTNLKAAKQVPAPDRVISIPDYNNETSKPDVGFEHDDSSRETHVSDLAQELDAISEDGSLTELETIEHDLDKIE